MSHDEQRSRWRRSVGSRTPEGWPGGPAPAPSHPWRVVFGWLAATVLLIVLVAGFHGSLANEFSVPGTDFQKATDLIKAKFGAQDGAALRVVMAAPPGESLDTPERKVAVAKMVQIATDGEKSLDENPDNAGSINDPLAPDSGQLSESGASPSSTRSSTRRDSSCRAATWSISRISCVPPASRRASRSSSPARPRARRRRPDRARSSG